MDDGHQEGCAHMLLGNNRYVAGAFFFLQPPFLETPPLPQAKRKEKKVWTNYTLESFSLCCCCYLSLSPTKDITVQGPATTISGSLFFFFIYSVQGVSLSLAVCLFFFQKKKKNQLLNIKKRKGGHRISKVCNPGTWGELKFLSQFLFFFSFRFFFCELKKN